MATIEAKTIKPKLRFEEYNNSWKVVTLSEILDFKNGVNASKEDYGTGYKFINVLDIIDNDFITHDNIKGFVNITESIFIKNIVEYGDILFQRSSETREEVGQSNVYLDRINPATFGGFVIRGKKSGDYVPFFLHLALKTPKARKEITSKSGGSTRYNVGQNTLSEVKVILPNIPEQQKIASFLSAVDKRIALLEHKKTKLEEYKKGVMQKIFSQKVRFKDENGYNFPEWEKKKLGEIAQIKTGSSNRVDSNLQSQYTFFDRSQEVRKSDKYLFDCEAVIVAGEGQEFIPKHFVGKFDLHQRTYAIMQFKKADGRFLYYYLTKFRHYFYSQAVGSTVKSLRLPMFQKMNVLLPCLEEQNKIAAFLTSIDEKISLVEKQIEGSNKFKKGLLQQMFV